MLHEGLRVATAAGLCPRCLSPAASDARFCRRCGLQAPDGGESLNAGARVDAVLRRLYAAADAARFAPFLPRVPESDEGFLALHPRIGTPDELYTLAEVRAAYPAGLDGRHVAWIWRRLLYVLGFVHRQGVAHGAVLPPNVLIDPREHKLVLVGWHAASIQGGVHTRGPQAASAAGPYLAWYRREGAGRGAATVRLDLGLAARSMIYLLGGDPLVVTCPPDVEPALVRHLARCVGGGGTFGPGGTVASAWSLLAEFDRLIEVLWGPRTFRELRLPPKSPAAPPAPVTTG